MCEREEIKAMVKQESLMTRQEYTTNEVPRSNPRISLDPAQGAIVNVSSIMGVQALPNCAPYIISKHGGDLCIIFEKDYD